MPRPALNTPVQHAADDRARRQREAGRRGHTPMAGSWTGVGYRCAAWTGCRARWPPRQAITARPAMKRLDVRGERAQDRSGAEDPGPGQQDRLPDEFVPISAGPALMLATVRA